MTTVRLIEYEAAVPEVRAVYDEIMAGARGNRLGEQLLEGAGRPSIHAAPYVGRRSGSDGSRRPRRPSTKEMLYLAVSIANNCEYCIHSHTASARRAGGMTDAMYGELLAVVGMASETNSLANATRVPVDPRFQVE